MCQVTFGLVWLQHMIPLSSFLTYLMTIFPSRTVYPKHYFLRALYMEGVVVRAFNAWQGFFSKLAGGERMQIVEHGSLVL